MDHRPSAFLSYTHFDNIHNGDFISKLCCRLGKEVQLQRGDIFQVFQDKKDIMWGQKWKERIQKSLNVATFLIPIITPSFFKSENCRKEVLQFLQYQEDLQRKDFILPVYYINTPLLENDLVRQSDHLAQIIASYQYADWRDLRFFDFQSLEVSKAIANLASQIFDALERTRNIEHGRDHEEPFYTPHKLRTGNEQSPLPGYLAMHYSESDPRKLLESALEKKQNGDYQTAKELHLKLIQSDIDWGKHVDLFVDQLYFSISLHDKLEEWNELHHLERLVFIPNFSKVEKVISTEAYRTIRSMYQSSMALALLRQAKLEDALERIEDALERKPGSKGDPGAWILYANALTTRAIIKHAFWSYRDQKRLFILNAQQDLKEAELIYKKHAKMGKQDEFHHLGRFYGTRSFLRIAAWIGDIPDELNKDKLLNDAIRAHQGKNRTAYGRIAGSYCDAFSRYKLAMLEKNNTQKIEFFRAALKLLNNSCGPACKKSSLPQIKIFSLSIEVANELNKLGENIDISGFNDAYTYAKRTLESKGYYFIDNLPKDSWLSTPLN